MQLEQGVEHKNSLYDAILSNTCVRGLQGLPALLTCLFIDVVNQIQTRGLWRGVWFFAASPASSSFRYALSRMDCCAIAQYPVTLPTSALNTFFPVATHA